MYQKLLELLKKYNLVDNSTEVDEDWDEADYEGSKKSAIVDLLSELIEDRVVEYCELDDTEFEEIIESYAHAAKLKITDLSFINPDEDDDSDEEEMSLKFKHAGQNHAWSYEVDDSDEFFKEITKWAVKALDGNVLFIGDEGFWAFCVPKGFVNDLKTLGISSDVRFFK